MFYTKQQFYLSTSIALCALLAAGVFALAAPASTLPVSKGVYRIPYANGTEVRMSNDHTNHPNALNRLDMYGINDSGDYAIVAAASGWIRVIVDHYTLSQCERSNPACGNNYVWIEHPNGEWSKYSHFQTGTVTHRAWSVGQWIAAGEVLGLEGDIGLADGPHLHFEIAVPNDPNDPIGDDRFGLLQDDGDGDDTYNRQNRIPVFCDIGFVNDGDVVTAAACQQQCDNSITVGAGVNNGEIRHIQANNDVSTFNNVTHVVASGGSEALRAGQRVVLNPGFHAEVDAYFSASIGACDSPGAN